MSKNNILIGLTIIVLFAISNTGWESTTTNNTTTNTTIAQSSKPTVPTEYISALKTAKIYGTTMSMSKAGIYDQLTS